MAGLWKKITSSATLMTWSNQFVNFGSALFILPLLLKRFDELEIAFWFMVNIFIQLARLADSGFGPTLIRAVSYFKAGAKSLPLNKKDFEEIEVTEKGSPNLSKMADLLSTSNRIYLILSLFAMLLLSTLGVAVTWNIFEMSDFRPDFIWAFVLIIVNSYIVLQTVKWTSFMTGLDFVAKSNGFYSILGSIRVFVYIAILLIYPSVLLLIAYNLLTSIAIFLYLRNYVRKWFAKQKVDLRKHKTFDKEIFKAIWPATWKLGGIYWGNYLITYGTSIIIAQIDDTALMAGFLFTQRIMFIIRRIAEAPFYANIQKTYKLLAFKDFVGLKKLVSMNVFLAMSIVFSSLTIIGVFGNWGLELLGIETRIVPPIIYVLMMLMTAFEIHGAMHGTIYSSTNLVPFLIPSLVSGAVVVIGGFLVLPVYGVLGLVLLQFLTQLSFNYWYSWYLSLKLVKWPLLEYLKDVLRAGVRIAKGEAKIL
jgi:hypothetical protein